ncbi:hypothetical protein HOY82DRAFT_49685 [Tuber indicum]|nr:hypothetical protein HOY82DRAFT_49685 [Tuber indicum]
MRWRYCACPLSCFLFFLPYLSNVITVKLEEWVRFKGAVALSEGRMERGLKPLTRLNNNSEEHCKPCIESRRIRKTPY